MNSAAAGFPGRELAYTLASQQYVRYLSYPSATTWQHDLATRVPHRIHIGAAYAGAPVPDAAQGGGGGMWRSRELVFDLDVDAYDAVRVCRCVGAASLCPSCERLLLVGARVVDMVLRHEFGFSHIAWFTSGRRGLHAWVSDARARALDAEARAAVASYIGQAGGAQAVNTLPAVARRLRLYHQQHLEPYVRDVLIERHAIFTEPGWRDMLRASVPGVPAAWPPPVAAHSDGSAQHSRAAYAALTPLQQMSLAVAFAYPRLDDAVTRHPRHLLKAPFSVHPATGNICVPVHLAADHALPVIRLADLIDAPSAAAATAAAAEFAERRDAFAQFVRIAAAAATV